MYLSSNPNDLAYTPDLKLPYCQRCFRLKHYGINSKTEMAEFTSDKVLKELKINNRDWIILINDILNIDFEIIDQYKKHPNLIFVFNKVDLFLSDFNYSKINARVTNLLQTYGINKPNIIITSTRNNYGIRKLFEFIDKIDWNEKTYFIGKTNSGKSSIINALIKYSGSVITPLTISNYLNTTIDVKQIKLRKHCIIDTPGYNSKHSILSNLIELTDVGSITNKQKIKALTFQIKEPQAFIGDSLFWIKAECVQNGLLIFYMPNKLKIQRTKIINLERNLKNPLNNHYKTKNNERKEHTFDLIPQSKYNLIVEGLGMVVVKGIKKIQINSFANVKISLLSDWII